MNPLPSSPDEITEGVFFGLSPDLYHPTRHLGSSNIKQLSMSTADYWWNSVLNPARPAEENDDTPARLFGRAVHTMVLDGPAVFARKYIRRPDSVKTLTEKIRKEICPPGYEILDGPDFDRIKAASAMISKNEFLAEGFAGGRSEVSIFWQREMEDGLIVPLKSRLDYLKVRAVGDLKSIRNTRGIPFRNACVRSFSDYRYDIQAAHYSDGRRQLARLVNEGKVYGEHDPAWLADVAACEEFAFVFVFYQASSAPITWGMSLSPGNPILDIGKSEVEASIFAYHAAQRRFGLDAAWVYAEPLEELDINDLPPWHGRK